MRYGPGSRKNDEEQGSAIRVVLKLIQRCYRRTPTVTMRAIQVDSSTASHGEQSEACKVMAGWTQKQVPIEDKEA